MPIKFVSIHRYDASGRVPDLYAVAVVKFIDNPEDIDVERGIYNLGYNRIEVQGTFPKEVCEQYLSENGASKHYQNIFQVPTDWAAYVIRYILPYEWQKDILDDPEMQRRVRIYDKEPG
jgi:hypothetical protein